MNILVLNAGSASLKFEVIAAAPNEDVLEDYEQLITKVESRLMVRGCTPTSFLFKKGC
jgi:acetate kinase